MTPTILFVPGFWEGPTVYNTVASLLNTEGFKTETAILPSTGTTSPGNPGMKDDIAAIRRHLSNLVVSRGEEVVLVLHSAGGFLGSEAMSGLSKKKRVSEGQTQTGPGGGVVGIVFLSGAVFPEGFEHQPLPFAVVDGGASHCAQPETLLFNDLPDNEKSKWLAALRPQPAHGWDDKITYTGWKDVPSVYLICESDKVLPTAVQEQLAHLAGSKVERCSAGHVPQLSQPERVVEVIKAASVSFLE